MPDSLQKSIRYLQNKINEWSFITQFLIRTYAVFKNSYFYTIYHLTIKALKYNIYEWRS